MAIEDKVPKFIPACKHDSYCHKLATMPKAHCSEDYMKVCGKVKQYYDRYGDMFNKLGVGAVISTNRK